jgi:hypothetical protein
MFELGQLLGIWRKASANGVIATRRSVRCRCIRT